MNMNASENSSNRSGLQSYEETLVQVREAASAGDPIRMVEALYESHFLDGLVRRISGRWSGLGWQSAEDVVASAVEVLYQSVHKGEKVYNPLAFLWKVADHKADHAWRILKREIHTESLESIAAKENEDEDYEPDTQPVSDESSARDDIRVKAINMARQLVPRLGQQNVQEVMAYVIDAVEAGRWDVSNKEIGEALGLSNATVRTSLSRGFHRLRRIAVEEGLIDERVFDDDLLLPDEEEI